MNKWSDKMVKVTCEVIDNVDMAEYANETGEPLGTIALSGGSVMDTEFEQPDQAAYVVSDFLNAKGWYNTVENALAALAYCIAAQENNDVSEFVIPAHSIATRFLYFIVGDDPTRK
jgi:hypothetical protein